MLQFFSKTKTNHCTHCINSANFINCRISTLFRLTSIQKRHTMKIMNINPTAELEKGPSVSEYYAGKSIFVTGVTGFVGKILLEKLMRSCSRIGHIYLLIRAKKNETVNDRLRNIVNHTVFEMINKRNPEMWEKVTPIQGDLSELDLGMTNEDLSTLRDKVNVVFHSAATVKFNEPLKFSVEMNVLGTDNIMKFCRELKHLEAWVYVSTAYANCHLGIVEEAVVPSKIHPRNILELLKWGESDVWDFLESKLLDGRPNFYTLSKNLAENLLREEAGDLPLVIVRPSIVTGCWREPDHALGWVDNGNGAAGVIAAASKGIMRNMLAEDSCKTNWVPVDSVSNSLIAAAWSLGTKRTKPHTVFNCVNTCPKQLNWNELKAHSRYIFTEYPPSQLMWYPEYGHVKNRILFRIYWSMFHTLPAYLYDIVLWLSAKKTGMARLMTKIEELNAVLCHFTTNQWIFNHDNLLKLQESLSSSDKEEFKLTTCDMDAQDYVTTFYLGIRKHLLKDDPDTIPDAVKQLKWYNILRHTAHVLGVSVVIAACVWLNLLTRMRETLRPCIKTLPLSRLPTFFIKALRMI